MSFEINGQTWVPQSTEEHADNIIDKVNAILQAENVTDASGNVIQLKKNYANAMYLLALGDGARIEEFDEKLEKAINSFNIELCDDAQIENLLPIAAVTRNPGSYSTLELTITASTNGACVIPAGTKAPFENVNFVTQTEVVISAGATQTINTICDTIGPVAVLTGEVTAFDTTIANLESVINPTSSVPGVAQETTNELRKRLIAGETIKYTLDGCKRALEELTGVSYARVYFNYNTSSTITLPGGVVLQPRTAYIVILGESDQIAETYATYMNAPTQNAPGAPAQSQNWVTSSGQSIPIYYDSAAEQTVYVKVVLEKDAQTGDYIENQIKRDLLIASAGWKLGDEVNGILTSAPFVDCDYTSVAYTKVSTDGQTWTDNIEIGCNTIARVNDDTIIVESLE